MVPRALKKDSLCPLESLYRFYSQSFAFFIQSLWCLFSFRSFFLDLLFVLSSLPNLSFFKSYQQLIKISLTFLINTRTYCPANSPMRKLLKTNRKSSKKDEQFISLEAETWVSDDSVSRGYLRSHFRGVMVNGE